jgi:HSP20 family protein
VTKGSSKPSSKWRARLDGGAAPGNKASGLLGLRSMGQRLTEKEEAGMALRDPTAWMWEEALELLERADRLQHRFFRLQRSGQACPSWEPPVDVFEVEDELIVLVALPGVRPQELEVLMDASTLIIRGLRPIPAICRNASISRLEIPHGAFERRIGLPPGEFKLRRQVLRDGCLGLTLARLRPSCGGGT